MSYEQQTHYLGLGRTAVGMVFKHTTHGLGLPFKHAVSENVEPSAYEGTVVQ